MGAYDQGNLGLAMPSFRRGVYLPSWLLSKRRVGSHPRISFLAGHKAICYPGLPLCRQVELRLGVEFAKQRAMLDFKFYEKRP